MTFVDTGAFLARYLAGDQNHGRAAAAWRSMLRTRRPVYTSNFVLDETFTNLGRRSSYTFAAQVARGLLADPLLVILRPGHDEEVAAMRDFEKFADQHVSFTDCTSFVLMRANKLRRAFTFDRHFSAAGFEMWPD